MINTVIRAGNGDVMVFDAGGEQLPEYQGHYALVRGAILRDAPPEAVFLHWPAYAADPETVSRTGW